jgi:hypothetical protein
VSSANQPGTILGKSGYSSYSVDSKGLLLSYSSATPAYSWLLATWYFATPSGERAAKSRRISQLIGVIFNFFS